MVLKKENYTFLRVALPFLFLFVGHLIFGQYCKVFVAQDPASASALSLPKKVSQTGPSHCKVWTLLENGIDQDNKSVKADFTQVGFSQVLKFSDFGFNIPAGAIVNGIKAKISGRRSGTGYISDYDVRLTNGTTQSINKSGKGYNAANVFAKKDNFSTWAYGDYDDAWGKTWTSAEINNALFGLDIQVLSTTSKPVLAEIDFVTIEVFYTPLPTYCTTECFTMYTDIFPNVAMYRWKIPTGWQMISRSEICHIIDFKVMNAVPGIYDVCVDALGPDGTVLGTCCRPIRIRNCTPAVIGNFVWNDINYNGLQDTGEPGLANVKIDVYSSNDVLIKSTTTNAQGQYSISGLEEKRYYLLITPPANFIKTINNTTDAIKNSDFLGNSLKSNLFFAEFGLVNNDLDFGLVKQLTVGDFVWDDLNYNGIQDANEPGIKDVKVYAFNEASKLIDSTITDATGKYSFKLPAAKYSFTFRYASGYLITKSLLGSDRSKDSDLTASGTTSLYNFENQNQDLTIDAGFYQYASIGDFVWKDQNYNGVQDANEPGTDGLKIYLYKNNIKIDSTISGPNGVYGFKNLVPDLYSLEVLLPEDTEATVPNPASNGNALNNLNGRFLTNPVTLISGQINADIDLGYRDLISGICGIVWNDVDANGSFEVSEPLVDGIIVKLLDQNGALINQSITSEFGTYCFDSLLRGNYQIRFEGIPDDVQLTYPNIGNDLVDSDVTLVNGAVITDLFFLPPADTLYGVNAGLVRKSLIGNFVWHDKDYNGIQEPEEVGIPDVSILLYDEQGIVIDETITDQNGMYFFQNIAAGKYKIAVSTPSGFAISKLDQSLDEIDSDIKPDGSSEYFDLAIGQDNLDLDAGYIHIVSIGDFVWDDKNADGIFQSSESGLDGVIVELYDSNDKQIGIQLTSNGGQYQFNNVLGIQYYLKFRPLDLYVFSPSKVGNDNSIDSDVLPEGVTSLLLFDNSDFSIDAGIYKKACIGDQVFLDQNLDGIYDSDIDTKLENIKITLQDTLGVDQATLVSDDFGQYSFCNLLPNTYRLKIELNPKLVVSQNSSLLWSSIGNDIYISNNFMLCSGDSIITKDIAVEKRPPAQICGKVWTDSDANGLYATGEKVLSNVTVLLYDFQSAFLDQTITDQDGNYCFLINKAGSYIIEFCIGDSLQFTTHKIGGDPTIDCDVAAGYPCGVTSDIDIALSQKIENIDAGVTFRSSLEGLVWFDQQKNGILEALEVPIPNVIIQLLDQNGSLVNTTASDVQGHYKFLNLASGRYQVKFQNNPNFDFTFKNADPVIGSDANPDGTTDVFDVLPNINYKDLNAGYTLKGAGISGVVWKDETKDNLLNAGDNFLSVQVELINTSGIVVSTVFSDATNGRYSFFPINDGQYYLRFASIPDQDYILGSTDSDVTNQNGIGTTDLYTVTSGDLVMANAGYVYNRATICGVTWSDNNGNRRYDVNTEPTLSQIKIYLQDLNGTTLDSTMSDAEGKYLFTNLIAGSYKLLFSIDSDDFTYALAINDSTNYTSIINLQGQTDTIILINGQKYIANGGYRGFGSIVGTGFYDKNENHLNDDASPVKATFIELVDENNQIIAIDTTDAQGNYIFDRIASGFYKVRVHRPLYYIFSDKDILANTEDTIDCDFILMGQLLASSDLTLVSSNVKIDYDFGLIFRQPMNSSISGVAWLDTAVDGIRQSGEVLIKDVEMILYNQEDDEVAKTTTDTLGRYTFTSLPEGFYYVKSTLPAALTPTYYLVGNDRTLDNDFTDAFTQDGTVLFYLGVNTDTASIDLGVTAEAIIGDRVWNDANFNGIQDIGEVGMPNVKVALVKEDGSILKSTSTNQNGNYTFSNIPTGKFKIKFSKVNGFSQTKKDQTTDTNDSDIDADYNTELITFGVGPDLNVDAGYVANASVGDRVWIDFNANGIQNQGEPGIDSILVQLFDDENKLIATATTKTTASGVLGYYQFSGLRPGNYYIKIIIPQKYLSSLKDIGDDNLDSDIDASGSTAVFTLDPGANRLDVDAGIYLPGCIGDRVWIDTDKDGLQDPNEKGLAGVKVDLFRSNGTQINTTTTDVDGKYLFNNLAQGLFYVQITLPSGYAITMPKVGDDNSKDSDIQLNGSSVLLSLAHGAKFLDLDAGLILSGFQLDARATDVNLPSYIVSSPNPALQFIGFDIPQESCNLEIYDDRGRLVQKVYGYKRDTQIEIKNIQNGIYYVKIIADKYVSTSRFIKAN